MVFRVPRIVLAVFCVVATAFGAARAQAPAPEKIDQLIQLLDDPGVQAWLAAQRSQNSDQQTTPPPAAAPGGMEQSMVSSSLDRIKAHIGLIANAVPELPAKFARARAMLGQEMAGRTLVGVALLIAFFVAVGIGFSYVTLKLTRPLRLWTISMPRQTPHGRVRKLGGRLVFAVAMIGAFVLGSAGTFLIFEWPPRLREVVLAYLTAAIIIWTVRMLTRFALLPPHLPVEHAAEVRILPMSDARAAHWDRWIFIIVCVAVIIAASFALLPTLGFASIDILALAVPIDFMLLGLVLAAVWLRPRFDLAEAEGRRLGHTAATWLLTAYFVTLFLIRTGGAFVLFWFAVAAVALPAAIALGHRAVHFVLRAPENEEYGRPVPAVLIAVIDRGIRMTLIVLAAYLLARVWGLDMNSMENSDPATTLLLRGLLNAVVIALAADFGWSIVKAVIERKLSESSGSTSGGEGEHFLDPQQARIRTLLPIFKNILFAVIIVMAILMILSSVGIQIGPLIAGAGVVGVAVGFGAQTLVKDVISGVFYLLDDAFRVGEYITSGKYMGTVESFSLRSIKLRHHRGPLFTIPFGELGAVQNQSRDWVTDKFNITVGYDTDLEFARKLIKKLGIELAADPEFAPHVIEPIKLQGVQNFGDYGVELRMKMTTRPGQAFGMKRKFYVRIKQLFKENGITIPGPSVHVHQDEAAVAVAAAQSQTNRSRSKKLAAVAGK